MRTALSGSPSCRNRTQCWKTCTSCPSFCVDSRPAYRKEGQLVQVFQHWVRFRHEGDPDHAVLIGAEIVRKTGKLRDHLARSRTRTSEPQTTQTPSRGLRDDEALSVPR